MRREDGGSRGGSGQGEGVGGSLRKAHGQHGAFSCSTRFTTS